MARFEHELRVQLRERRNRLYRADWRIWESEAGLMLTWMRNEPYLRGLLCEIEAAPIDPTAWQGGARLRQEIDFPDDESQRAKICLHLFSQKNPQAIRVSMGNFNEMATAFVEMVVDPLVNYLEDQIEEGNAILGVLERYKRRSEWFHQRDLYERYSADTAHGEEVLDAHLRECLVDQGISYPFSQPRSPSGQADVVALGDDPLALEIKLFPPDAGKDRVYIKQGFSQAYRYAADYGFPRGTSSRSILRMARSSSVRITPIGGLPQLG
jgi:hypothetical protein